MPKPRRRSALPCWRPWNCRRGVAPQLRFFILGGRLGSLSLSVLEAFAEARRFRTSSAVWVDAFTSSTALMASIELSCRAESRHGSSCLEGVGLVSGIRRSLRVLSISARAPSVSSLARVLQGLLEVRQRSCLAAAFLPITGLVVGIGGHDLFADHHRRRSSATTLVVEPHAHRAPPPVP